jgi:hypothetical protein
MVIKKEIEFVTQKFKNIDNDAKFHMKKRLVLSHFFFLFR